MTLGTTQKAQRAKPTRAIRGWGTAARIIVGGYLVGSVVHGSLTGDGTVQPEAWLLGLLGLPAVVLGLQWWRARRSRGRIVVLTGPIGHLLTGAVFLLLYTTTWYAPSIGFVSDAALLFFGSAMILAAVRGDAGCEVLSVSNWLLRRDDRIGCVLFDPVDQLESRHADRRR